MAAKSKLQRSAKNKKTKSIVPKPKKTVSKTAQKSKSNAKTKISKSNASKKPVKTVSNVQAAKKLNVKAQKPKTKSTAKPLKTKPQVSKIKSVTTSGFTTTKAVKKVPKPKPTIKPVSVKAPSKSVQSKPKVTEAYASIIREDLNAVKTKPKEHKVLAITNAIPKSKKDEISLTKIASIAHSLTNVPKSIPGYAVKTEKEPPGKFEMEFVIRASGDLIYEFFSTPSGLSEWFCDDLNIRNGVFTFIWDDQIQQARLLKTIDGALARFQWVEKTDGSYFEFKIQKDDLTNDISLIITDFADTPADLVSSKKLWQSQIEKLMQVLGSVY